MFNKLGGRNGGDGGGDDSQSTIKILINLSPSSGLNPFLAMLGGGGGSGQHWRRGLPKTYQININ